MDMPMLAPRYPRIVTPVANHLARKEIERQWRARGLRVTRYSEIIAQAQTYLAEHRAELFEQALARVRASPWHSAMVVREERELERQQRNRARTGVIENPSRSVAQSDSANSGTEKTQLFSTTSTIFRCSCLLNAD
jgi:hypothetical protein